MEKKVENKVKKWILPVSIIISLVLLDQITKLIVVKKMFVGEQISIIKNFFYITSHRNNGAAWSILEGQMLFFYLVTAISLVIMIYCLIKIDIKKSTLSFYGVVLLIAGTLGNFIDRIVKQEVVDFLDFIIFGYDYPTFNVADSVIVIGAILLFKDMLFPKKDKNVKESENNEEK